MKRPILVCTLFVAVTAVLGAQEPSQTSPYQGTSNPPSDDQITTSSAPAAKPPAGQPVYIQPVAPAQAQVEPQPTSVDTSVNDPDPGNENGMRAAPVRPQPAGFDAAQLRLRSGRRHCASASPAAGRNRGRDHHSRPAAGPAFDRRIAKMAKPSAPGLPRTCLRAVKC